MQGNKHIWEHQYAKKEKNLWGLKPIDTLVEYASLVEQSGKVLDLGMGEGRNALYYAGKGFNVEGIDISETAVNRAISIAEDHGLRLEAKVNDLISLEIEENAYSVIILANVLTFFKDEEIKQVIDKAKKGLMEGGLLYINAFNTQDPSYEKNVMNAEKISDHTFYRSKSDSYIHFFTRKELESYFEGYQTIKVSESYLLDVSHGEPHYHGTVEMMVKK
ncbi:class I SAM-dependent methyltransferase [Lysinibacillus sphaericus]